MGFGNNINLIIVTIARANMASAFCNTFIKQFEMYFCNAIKSLDLINLVFDTQIKVK